MTEWQNDKLGGAQIIQPNEVEHKQTNIPTVRAIDYVRFAQDDIYTKEWIFDGAQQ